MEENYEAAFCEVLEVIAHSEPKVKERIPHSFIAFLNDNKDPNYKPSINFEDPNWDEKLMQEARIVIGLIYRDFVADPEEKAAFIAEEKEEARKAEEELREKYNPDNIFKKPEPKVEVQQETVIENVPDGEIKGYEPGTENSLSNPETKIEKIKSIFLGIIDKIKNMIKK